MILVDTSVWVDYLRGSPTAATREVRRLVEAEADQVATCEPVAMELLAGAAAGLPQDALERLINGLPSLPLDVRTDFRTAAAIYRAARARGRTVRSLNDCLIATIAISASARLLHKDADFDVIGEITELDAVSLR